jgi:hypothetical protein
MGGDPWTREELLGLADLSGRLSHDFEGAGGLLIRADLEIAREAMRRARRAEQAEATRPAPLTPSAVPPGGGGECSGVTPRMDRAPV